MLTSDFDYNLPKECIAQRPAHPRDSSRLLRFDRDRNRVEHFKFSDLPEILSEGDLLVWNNTRVFPARLTGSKIPTGGRVELLLLKRIGPLTWEALVGGKRLSTGKQIGLDEGLTAKVVEVLDGPRRILQFNQPVSARLSAIGEMPLPPYITTPLQDPGEYQTVYAEDPGSAAAPTAGLHFTERLIADLERRGVRFAAIDLQIGLDTFAPVNEADPTEHHIHTEWCRVPGQAVEAIIDTKQNGRRVIAVGTTTVRALETAAASSPSGKIEPFEGATDLYILPGYDFRVVDSLITNFHLPRSTLLMMVSAFTGRETLLDIYRLAIREGYRFYSFGDAMLII